MADLLAKYPKIRSAIMTYRHDAFVDTKFAWKIVGQADEIRRLIHETELKECTTDHVKFKDAKFDGFDSRCQSLRAMTFVR